MTRDVPDEFRRSFVPYFTDFLDFVKENRAPLDFFSWHIYNGAPAEVIAHAKFVRETLDASYVASVMCELQRSGLVDTAMYYVASRLGVYNGLFCADDGHYYKPYYALAAWGELHALGGNLDCEYNLPGVSCAAAVSLDSTRAGVLLSNHGSEAHVIELTLDNILPGQVMKMHVLDESGSFARACAEAARRTLVRTYSRGEQPRRASVRALA